MIVKPSDAFETDLIFTTKRLVAGLKEHFMSLPREKIAEVKLKVPAQGLFSERHQLRITYPDIIKVEIRIVVKIISNGGPRHRNLPIYNPQMSIWTPQNLNYSCSKDF